MTMGVVDFFEVVQVKHDEPVRATRRGFAFQQLRKFQIKPLAVEHLGPGIMLRLIAYPG